MGDAIEHQALAQDIARRLQLASHDELRVLDRILVRLELGRDRYGRLDIGAPRPWRRELAEELLDAVVYDTIDTIRAEDEERAKQLERSAMLGTSIAYPLVPLEQPLIAVSAINLMDAPPELRARALDSMEQECRRLTIESERDELVSGWVGPEYDWEGGAG